MKLNVKMRSVAIAAATLSVAAMAGVFLQGSGPSQASAVAPEKSKLVAPVVQSSASNSFEGLGVAIPRDQDIPVGLPVQTVALDVAVDVPTAQMPNEEPAPLLGCDVALRAVPAVAAMVNLHISADCLPNARIRIEHADLRFSEFLDDFGKLEITVPALEIDARFSVVLPNGSLVNAVAHVPDLELYNRVAMQWMGESGLQIHARENTADYGDKGHVWFENQGDLINLVSGKGGFLMRMGDASTEWSLMADVYTYPAGKLPVFMTAEIEVNGANCDRLVKATTLQVDQAISGQSHTLELTMPECGATGDFLVLKNLFQNPTIAQQ